MRNHRFGRLPSLADFWAIARPPGQHLRRPARRRVVELAICCAVVVSLGACSSDSDVAPGVASDVEVSEVMSALATLETAPEEVAATGVTDKVGDLRQALPEGSTVEADPKTWLPDGTGSGGLITVSVTTDGDAKDYLALMVKESDGWKVLMTLPAEEGAAS